MGMPGQGMACLSPIVAALNLNSTLMTRFYYDRQNFWWIAFWDIECAAMAVGLLWLTVRTFDKSFGRIPERPRETPVLADVILVLAAVIGVGGLFGAITLWIRGLGEWSLEDTATLAFCVLVTGGFILLSAIAPLSIIRRDASDIRAVETGAAVIDRSAFTRRWWQTFRLVLVLSIGPALFALALATARAPVHVTPKVTTLAGGVTEKIETHGNGTTYVETIDASGSTFRFATDDEIAAATPVMPSPPIWRYLGSALLAVFTIMVHGAAFVSIGLALGIWIRSRAQAIAGSVCVFVCVTIGSPILYVLVAYPTFPRGLTLASFPGSFGGLLLHMRRDRALNLETVSWALFWNVVFMLVSVVVVALAKRTLDRRCSVQATKPHHVEFAHTAETPLSAG